MSPLRWAANFAGNLQSKVTLLHIAPHLQPVPGLYYLNPDWRTLLINVFSDELTRIGKGCEVRIEEGEAIKAVVHVASELKADLLVIGRSPYDGLIGALRANAYAIISQSPCPALSV